MSKKNVIRTLIVIIILAVITAGLFAARVFLKKKTAANITYTVLQEVYQNAIDIAGTISAAQSQTLQALSDGTVVSVNVKQGDLVHKGDVIIQLDDSTQLYNLAKQDYDMATTRISGSRKELELMETQRAALLQKIAERKVIATFDGIIADIDVAVGDSLAAKDSVGTLVDKTYLEAQVEIAETDVAKLEVGQPVEFSFPAYQDGKVEGYVVGWPELGEVTSRGATVVKAKLRIDSYPESILPNFSFSGKIKIAPDETYLLVSKYAVGREDGKAFVVKAGTTEKIPVSVTPFDKNYVKITSGSVAKGDQLTAQSTAPASGRNRNAPGGKGMGVPGGGGMGSPRPRM